MTRRDDWRKCVEDHASEDWRSVCDACMYLPEVYAELENVEACLDRLLGLERLTNDDGMCNVCYLLVDEAAPGCEAHDARAALARLISR